MAEHTDTFYVSSWTVERENVNAVCVVEQRVTTRDDGTENVLDTIQIYDDPVRPFFVTRPEYRNHEYKKEFEQTDRCEEYLCRSSMLVDTLAKALGRYNNPFRPLTLRRLCSSPFVYVADIPAETFIKQDYLRKTPVGKMARLTRGGLDIETEVRGDERIIAITFIHEHTIYTAVLKEYCRIHDPSSGEGENARWRDANLGDCRLVVDRLLGNFLTEHGFTLNLSIQDSELELIKWIFARIHECKTHYVGVWNLSFDMTRILKRLTALGVDPASVMCHPDVDPLYRVANWCEDTSDVDHYTDRWHWMTLAGYTQFVDSMCLYARLRKVSGKDTSYSLDYISTKELGTGKLHFGDIMNHWYQQNFNFLEYIAYNINDVVIMQLMEYKNNDIIALAGQCGKSLASQFARQTVMLRDDSYDYGRTKGRVPASVGNSMITDVDKIQGVAGGTVLPPNKALGVSAPVVRELPGESTLVSLFTNDLDFSSLYPTTTSSFNISKETALSTIVHINGKPADAVEHLSADMIDPRIGAENIAHEIFNLPSYVEMGQIFEQWLADHPWAPENVKSSQSESEDKSES